MAKREGIFPTFFLSGFECSSFLWGAEKKRRDLNAKLRHYEHADEDYAMLPPLGIAVAREGIPWPLVDKGHGEYDFSPIDGFLAAQRRYNILPIWDLCHYGYPDDLDPYSEEFVIRFAAYAKAAARYVSERAHHGPLLITPMNEPTFWGYMGGEWGWCAPFGKTREERRRFTCMLPRADIAGCKGIRAELPDTRFVHIDPLIWVVPPRDRPDWAEAAHREAYEDAYLAWDIISGIKHPEYGGSLELIEEARKKYKRPCIVAETSGISGGRPDWLNDMTCEALSAVNRGVDLHGICLFPAVDMTDWHNGRWLHMGIADVEELPDGALMRTPFVPYTEALRQWQQRLGRVTELDDDPFDEPVDLNDVIRGARELAPSADANWD